jgi:hypothetical protein
MLKSKAQRKDAKKSQQAAKVYYLRFLNCFSLRALSTPSRLCVKQSQPLFGLQALLF